MGGAVSPFLRWAGSKRKLLPELTSCWRADFGRYVEPFMGSAVLYFSLRPENALLSDINAELTEAFTAVRDTPDVIYELVSRLPQCKDGYYAVRSVSPRELTMQERAARFVYLNRFCFNGLYRTNNRGEFNVPYAGKKTPRLIDEGAFHAAARALDGVTIETGDFETVLRRNVRQGDFIYLDPPYAVRNQRIFRQYGPETFGLLDLERTAALLRWIVQQGASFVLSYAKSPESDTYFSEWPTRLVEAQRNIAGFADRRRKAVEALVSSDATLIDA